MNVLLCFDLDYSTASIFFMGIHLYQYFAAMVLELSGLWMMVSSIVHVKVLGKPLGICSITNS